MGSGGTDGPGVPPGSGIASRQSSRNRLVEWVLVDGNRIVLTLCITAAVLAALLVLYAAGAIAFTNDGPVTRVASGMIAGTFSLVTLVVSVNQLILSQEFSPADEFRDRLQGVLTFRRDVEGATGVPAPPAEPTRLLELLATAVRHRAEGVADAVADHPDDAYRDRVTRYTGGVVESTERLDDALERRGVSAFEALTAALEYDDSWQLHGARHLRNDAPAPAGTTTEAFDDLVESLKLFATAQDHFKTIYLQRELTRFSQLTVYCGVPAALAAVLVGFVYGDVGGATIATAYLPYVTAGLVAVAFVPVALLASYILRTATLTRRTATIGPLFPQKAPDEGPFEVSYDEDERRNPP